MARVQSEKQINAFVRGLITEASPLTYPENATLDEDNFVLNRDGSRQIRLGIDYEAGYTLTDSGFTSTQLARSRIDFFRWDYAGGDENSSLGIIRILDKLWFVDLFKTNPSTYLKNSSAALTITGLGNAQVDFTVINHKVILVAETLEWPILLEYNATTDVVSQSEVILKIRDFFGVDDGLTIDERPVTLTNTHKYNLRNQGWSPTIISVCAETCTPTQFTSPSLDKVGVSASTVVCVPALDAIDCTFSKKGQYPSNADIWSVGKDADPTAAASFEKYSPDVLFKNSHDNGPAPKGRTIFQLYNRGAGREAYSLITGLPADIETGRVSTTATYAGRVFYSGILSSVSGGDSKSPNYSGYIFFSPTVISDEKLGQCYQEADPTSDRISDIIDTDGGAIHIPEISKVVKLVAIKSSLIVFAENGVWEVYGGDIGFRATEYQLNKITSVGIIGKESVIVADDTVAYWSKGGIYVLTTDQVSGRLTAQNVSLTTIQTLYNDIPEISKRYVKAVFDEREQTIRWLYNDSDTYTGESFVNSYTKELIFDLSLGAFYKHSIGSLDSNSPTVAAYITTPNFISSTLSEPVLVNGESVEVNLEQVVVIETIPATRRVEIAFLTIVPGTTYSFTISKYQNDSFLDWETADGTGIAIDAYLITGYELFGDILRKKQVPYILFYFERTENSFTVTGGAYELNNQSSCLVQAQWNWTDSANSGKWGTEFQAYRLNRLYIPSSTVFDYGEAVIVTKNKLRGSGRCLSLKIRNEAGKDMKLLGWAMRMSGNSDV